MRRHSEEGVIQNQPVSPMHREGNPYGFLIKVGLFFISASSITFEINLIRLFSVAQFYHFAFLIVSVVLLGSAASGSLLMVFPKLGRDNPRRFLSWVSILASLSTIGAYLLFNHLPFDSFSIGWDLRQAGILVLHYLVLSTPFFFCGLVVSFLLEVLPENTGNVYGVNLAGASSGCLLALLLPGFLGGEGIVLFCSALSAIGMVGFYLGGKHDDNHTDKPNRNMGFETLPIVLAGIIITMAGIDIGNRMSDREGFSWMSLKISPYKSLSYMMQFPGSKMITQDWNSFSRLSVVESAGIRSLPGLSYRYQSSIPQQQGLYVDGDDLSPVIVTTQDNFTPYMPVSIVYELRPAAKTLIMEPRGGLDVYTALAQGACCVTAVEQNPLIVSAAGNIYSHPKAETKIEFERSYLKRSQESFDVVLISLTSTYHPVQSGAYSLAEDYRYTVEALTDALARLNSNGILVFMRWLQYPPSEDLRAFGLAIEAVEQDGGEAQKQIVVFRGYNTTTIMVKRKPFTTSELSVIREFLFDRAFDLSYAPDVQANETNRYNILPESMYYQTYRDLISSDSRWSFYREYPYDITPPTDDQPFMGHYFKWSQIRQIMAEWGKTWQPFGGAGYLVVIGLLLMTIVMGSCLVLLPWIIRNIRRQQAHASTPPFHKPTGYDLGYFACIGFGYLLVEIPLIQKFILYLGQPAYAFAIVLFAILFFSGCGSLTSHKIPWRPCLLLTAGLVMILPLLLPLIFENTLGFSTGWRVIVSVLVVAPAGILMGIPFPAGLRWMVGRGNSDSIPWFWGINGAASVISAVLAAMLALALGFAWVLRIGALTYLLGWFLLILDSHQMKKLTQHR
ncbi:MAG: hypothetical protein JW908_05235 [Anaerolineales bacterium]|nr:hypothetical protein [Anaerolineales bacterium]